MKRLRKQRNSSSNISENKITAGENLANAKKVRPVGITGVGMFLPPKVVTNKDLEKVMDTTDEWIRTRIGIESRRFARKDQALSDICIPAAKAALNDAGVKAEDVDLIIVGAMSHDFYGVQTGNIIKESIGAKNAVAIDINIICSGAPTCIEIGSKFIRDGTFDTVLVINGEVFSKYEHSRVTKVIFGDGAGAAVLQPSRAGSGILSTYLGTRYEDPSKLGMLGGGSRYPPTKENIDAGRFIVTMDGPLIYKFAVDAFDRSVREAVKRADLKLKDIDFVISHQANVRIIKEGMERLGLPPTKTYMNIQKYGNIGGGSVLVALKEALSKKLIRHGDIVVLVAFGAGLGWGATVMRWC
jgi:3-oxoacyl-[acyl-carrier-protein] synthase-3